MGLIRLWRSWIRFPRDLIPERKRGKGFSKGKIVTDEDEVRADQESAGYGEKIRAKKQVCSVYSRKGLLLLFPAI
jgi:hypothetical protein